ncbi:MAG: SpoIID/LytB domain-containing protein [Ilumatobacteraceae bacterium]
MRIPLISFKSRIAAFLCAASLIVGLMPAQVAQAEEGQLPGGVIIYGRGFGHGRGLSQYGAYGWATVHGWSWEQILDFYYGGATGNSRSNLEAPNQEMTTWLSAMNNRQTGVVSDSGTMRLLEDPDQGRRFTSMVAREKSGAQRVYQVWGSGERKCLNESDSPEAAGFTLIGEFNETASFVTNSSQDPGASALDTVGLCEPRSASANQVRYYRGIVRAMNNTRNENRTINIARLDDYLRGVVPRESPASWGDTAGGAGMNALRAQAVAARSYSVTENRYAGLAKTCDTQDCQVYGGAALRTSVNASPTVLESANTDRAVAETTGVVIRNPKGNVVRTEFSSSNGGRTAGGEFPALADEGDISANSSLMIWTRAFSAAQIVAKYPQVGVLTSVTTTNDGLGGDFGGYTLDVTIAGTSGSVKVSGWAFRTAFGLPAPWFGATPVFGAPFNVVRWRLNRSEHRHRILSNSFACVPISQFSSTRKPLHGRPKLRYPRQRFARCNWRCEFVECRAVSANRNRSIGIQRRPKHDGWRRGCSYQRAKRPQCAAHRVRQSLDTPRIAKLCLIKRGANCCCANEPQCFGS